MFSRVLLLVEPQEGSRDLDAGDYNFWKTLALDRQATLARLSGMLIEQSEATSH